MTQTLGQAYEAAGGDSISEEDLTPAFHAYRLVKEDINTFMRGNACYDLAVTGFEVRLQMDGLTASDIAYLKGMIPADPDVTAICTRLAAVRTP